MADRPAHARRPASRDDAYVPRGPERLRRKARGQYLTPPALAQELGRYLAVDLAEAGHAVPPGGAHDPACGDGAFLEVAARWGWGPLSGVDLDAAVLRGPAGADLRVGDGLADPRAGFGVVLGNPPFSGRLPEAATDEGLLALAARAEIWRCDRSGRPGPAATSATALDRLRSCPPSTLFAERFLRAARPGGVVAALLPESFACTPRDAPARAYLLRHARCLSITSVHGRDFLRAGTRARTVWTAWIRRPEPLPRAEDAAGDPPVLLRQPRDEEDHELAAVAGSRSFVVRVPVRTLLATGRWDPRYHDPAWEDALRGCALPIRPLGDFVADLAYGALGRGMRPAPHAGPGGYLLVGQKAIAERGVLVERCPRIADARPFVQPRYTLRPGDLVIPRSGMGVLGKNLLTRWDGVPADCDAAGAVVDCFDDRLSLRGISSAWVLGVLRSDAGWAQIRRVIAGVAAPNLTFAQLRALRLPVPPPAVQEQAERLWGGIRAGLRPFEDLRALVRDAAAAGR